VVGAEPSLCAKCEALGVAVRESGKCSVLLFVSFRAYCLLLVGVRCCLWREEERLVAATPNKDG
jgi:hypothetical protein